MYYLNSRFYDQEIGRFINADGGISGVNGELLGYNMFAYCFNNPVNMSDADGEWPVLAVIVAVVVTAVVAVKTVNSVINHRNKKKIEKNLQSTYTTTQAKTAIDNIGNNRFPKIETIVTTGSGVNIKNSYTVTSRYERQEATMIIERTRNEDGSKLTKRTANNMAAEWLWHNIIYNLTDPFISNGKMLDLHERARAAALDCKKDSRVSVWLPSDILGFLGFE